MTVSPLDAMAGLWRGVGLADGALVALRLPGAEPALPSSFAVLLAFGTKAALLRQRREGGSWHVQVSLARTALWLRSLGRIEAGFAAPAIDATVLMESSDSGFGRLAGVRHAARFSATPARHVRASSPPGTDRLAWT